MDVGRCLQAYGPCGTDMEFSNIRGLVCFGILFVASFLLWPELFLRAFTLRQQLWVVRRLTNRHWTGVQALVTVLFVALTAWLVVAKSGNVRKEEREATRQNPASHSSMMPIVLQVRQ